MRISNNPSSYSILSHPPGCFTAQVAQGTHASQGHQAEGPQCAEAGGVKHGWDFFPDSMGKYQKIIGKIWEKPGFLRWENHRKRWEHPLSLEIPSKLKWWIFQQTIFDYRTVINPKHNWLLQVMLLLKVVLLEFHVCVCMYIHDYTCVFKQTKIAPDSDSATKSENLCAKQTYSKCKVTKPIGHIGD